MDINENIAGLGKDHDKSVSDNDLAKKQSEAKPATENLDMMPNSVSKQENDSLNTAEELNKELLHHQAKAYAQKEHDKAKDWNEKAQ